jgi:hypothetical protein
VARLAELEEAEPQLAGAVRAFFGARVHHMLATVRPDGSPRISGTEVIFAHGDVWLGSMWRSPKARDLIRDGRYALHSGSDDPPEWSGDAKLSGVAEEVSDPEVVRRVMRARGGEEVPTPFHLFRLEVAEVVRIALPDPPKYLIATRWRQGRGVDVRHLHG